MINFINLFKSWNTHTKRTNYRIKMRWTVFKTQRDASDQKRIASYLYC